MSEKELEALVLEILKMTLEADKQFWPVNMMSMLRPHLVRRAHNPLLPLVKELRDALEAEGHAAGKEGQPHHVICAQCAVLARADKALEEER